MVAGVSCHAAVVTSFFKPDQVDGLRRWLAGIHPTLAGMEEEEIFVNPDIKARLAEHGLLAPISKREV